MPLVIAEATLLLLNQMLGCFVCPLCHTFGINILLLQALFVSSHNKVYILMQEALNPL